MSIWSSIGSGISRYFSSGSGWGDLLGGVLSGLGSSAAAGREDKQNAQAHEWALAIEALRGDEGRRSTLFEKQLEDYYEQRDKYDKRMAIDTYGQFSVLDRRSPGYVPPARPSMPTAPRLEDFQNG